MAVPFGKYQLLKKIGVGGMGQVFLARHSGAQGFEKLVVIKRILPHLAEDPHFLTMFFDEARIAARLSHPNVAQIFEMGEVDGAHYLAMEYVPGENLRKLDGFARDEGLPLPVGAVCRIIAEAAAGLDSAHKSRDAQGNLLGLIHRDVSPQNILVGFDGGVKLIDFGVAKAIGRMQHTATGYVKGKHAYMSPEQAAGEKLDHRSDVFALGIVFWELLTGERLFKGESDTESMRKVRECLVPPVTTIDPTIPRALEDLVYLALARDPEDRFEDAGALRLAVENLILAEHLQASSAHLHAYMQKLYGDRIAKESDPKNLDELSSSDISRLMLHTGTPASEPALGGVSHPTRPERRPEISEGRGGSWKLPVAMGLGLILAGVTAFALPRFLRSESTVAAAPTVRLQLLSDPPGATVEVLGKTLGLTPLDVEAGKTPTLATLSLAGHEVQQVSFSQLEAPALTVTLKKKVKPKKDPVELDIKTGR